VCEKADTMTTIFLQPMKAGLIVEGTIRDLSGVLVVGDGITPANVDQIISFKMTRNESGACLLPVLRIGNLT
jgi:hypothetical protein